jgi:hypothetical protein
MILDANLEFSDGQAVTSAAGSDNTINTGKAGLQPGVGNQDLYLYTVVEEDMADSGSDSTLTVALEGDSTTTFTPDKTRDLYTFPAASPAGTLKYAKLDPQGEVENMQYLRLKYTPANGDLSGGKFSSGIIRGIAAWKAFAKNYVS